MKNRVLLLIIILVTVFATTASAYSSELSYGISVLRKGVSMRKCSISGEPVEFAPSDFEEALGVRRISAICINSLPERSLGALTLNGINVRKGQIIGRAAVSELIFTPSSSNGSVVEFCFSDAKDTGSEYICTINMLEKENSAPVAAEASFTTQKNIELVKTLSAFDKENDKLKFEIVSGTKKGRIRLLDEITGEFSYSPESGYVGKDSFSFEVYDSHGNVSEKAVVNLKVENPECDIFYSDMVGNRYHNEAIKLAAKGIMTGETIGKISCFHPKDTLTKAAFLRLCMIACNTPVDESTAVTGFDDDSEIASYDKPYVYYAAKNGIIESKGTFEPEKEITVKEAKAILKKLSKSESGALSVFLNESEDEILTREIAAGILCEIS